MFNQWFNNHMSNQLSNNLMFNKPINKMHQLKFSNNQDHKINLTLKTFQSKRLIPTMKPELTTSKFHMKDNMLNKLLNKELNAFQSPEPLPNIRPLLTPVMSQSKNNTLTINKSNTLPNMFQMSDKKLKLTMSHNKELNNTLTINQSRNNPLEPPPPSKHQWSNNQWDNQ